LEAPPFYHLFATGNLVRNDKDTENNASTQSFKFKLSRTFVSER